MQNDKEVLLNTHYDNLSMSEAVTAIFKMIQAHIPAYVMEINVDVVMKMEKDPYLRKISDEANLTLIDGQPLIWIARLYQTPVKERVAGSDLIPEILKEGNTSGLRIFILGGQKDVAERAARNIKNQYPGIKVCGWHSPESGELMDQEELRKIDEIIKNTHPDILLVCFGCPKQEKWVYEHYKTCGATVSICAGATVDFLAGTMKRAPKWMSWVGLEWFYRFLQEPGRLFNRYFVEDIKILRLLFKYKR